MRCHNYIIIPVYPSVKMTSPVIHLEDMLAWYFFRSLVIVSGEGCEEQGCSVSHFSNFRV